MAERALHRILLVDDDPDTRDAVRLVLEILGGYEVETCASGPEALRRAPSFRPDLVLLDLMMPDMDGHTTLVRLRSVPETRDVPVVLLTARLLPDELARCREVGAAGLVAKPCDPAGLVATIERIWGEFVAERRAAMAEKLAAKVAIFVAGLSEKVQSLEQAWEGCRRGGGAPALRTLHMLAHRLAGSAATFGLPALSDRARRLEALLDPLVAEGAPQVSPAVWSQIDTALAVIARAATEAQAPPSSHRSP